MVDAIVVDKVYNCTDLRSSNQNGRHSNNSNEGSRSGNFDTATNSEEKTISSETETQYSTGVFVGRTAKKNFSSEGTGQCQFGPSPQVNLVSSEDEEDTELKEIFDTPILKLGSKMMSTSKQNIGDFETFLSFSEALFQHSKLKLLPFFRLYRRI
ncbi:unnamed protein product [Macrosiphum euphorbiae]|uniref:Uncharacterized protein n=1 Tax=Macrosiphum euphorbiae TaxID=13131 RepID=A0AAV0XD26_9HEMI|nr:unnamed protein product [Macrosiphum euphorbiae]